MALLIMAAGFAGCSGNQSALSPTAPTAVTPAASAVTVTQIRAFIVDTGMRALGGVRVEILDGTAAGQAAMTDNNGVAVLNGPVTRDTRFQASKSGYETLTSRLQCSVASCPSNGTPYVLFYLRPLAPPLDLDSSYTMTITTDAACSSLPQSARARSYQVALTKRFREGTADLLGYDGTINADDVLSPVRRFSMNVAGNYLSIFFRRGEGEIAGLIEQVGDNTYVVMTASATGSVSQGTTLALVLSGTIEYVTTRTPLTGAVSEPIAAVSRETCESGEGHRLVLVRN